MVLGEAVASPHTHRWWTSSGSLSTHVKTLDRVHSLALTILLQQGRDSVDFHVLSDKAEVLRVLLGEPRDAVVKASGEHLAVFGLEFVELR